MLSDAELATIAREMKARSGAALTRDMGAAIELRLQTLTRREGFTAVSQLIGAAHARADGKLWTAINDALTHSETRFFRDRAQFAALRGELLPDALMRRGHERVRIWSAGCATGQEPYSIAMLADEMRDEGFDPAVEILGTDLSERLLDKARSGLYTQFEVQRGLPIRKLVAYFEKAGDLWRIQDRMRAAVTLKQHNLLHSAEAFGQFDIVMLIDVLPRLDAEARAGVLAHAFEALHRDGVLVLGAHETLPESFAGLACVNGIVRRADAARVAA